MYFFCTLKISKVSFPKKNHQEEHGWQNNKKIQTMKNCSICPEDFDFIFYSEMELQTEDWKGFEYKWKNQPSQKEDIDSERR